jgi:hypothetical protein
MFVRGLKNIQGQFWPAGSQGLAKRMDRRGPFPDCRLSWGSSPSDCRGAPFTGAEGGLMVSPRVGCAAFAAVPTL